MDSADKRAREVLNRVLACHDTVYDAQLDHIAKAIRDAVAEAVGTPLEQCAGEQIAHVMRNRERYVKAWVAATGHRPEESVLVQQQREDGSMAIWAELKQPTCPECGEPKATVSMCHTEDCCANIGETKAWAEYGHKAGVAYAVNSLTSPIEPPEHQTGLRRLWHRLREV